MNSNPAPSPSSPQLEESPKASEEHFRAAFDQSIMGIVLADLQGVCLQVNDAFCRIVGHPREEILGQTSYHITHPADREANAEAIRQLREGTALSTSFRKRYIRTNGEIVWTQITVSLIREADRPPERVIATVEDITEQKRTQEALQESEQRLRLIFESVTDYAIFTTDPAGIVTTWNPGAENIWGYSAAEIIGSSCVILWTEEDQANDAPAKELLQAQSKGFAPDERWHLTKQGTRFFASGVVRPMYEETGTLKGFTKICRDITAQRQVEHDLAAAKTQISAALESERVRLAEVFRRSPSFMAVLKGSKHVLELVNDRYYELVGHRDILYKEMREALPEVQGQGFFELLDRVYATGEPFVGKEMVIQLQRQPFQPLSQRYVDFVYQPMREADGSISGIFVHGIDITERKLVEHSLEHQSRVFDAALSAIKDCVFIFDQKARFVYANRMLLALWGLNSEEAFGKSMTELHYPENVRIQLERNIAQVFETGQSVMDEVGYISPIGNGGYFEYILAPVHDAEGKVESVAGTSRDISERKRAEQGREQLLDSERAARNEAERVSRLKDEFLATLGHELRTPLNAILGWSAILRADPDPEDVKTGIEVIERNARAQTRIIEDLLDMSRIISGKVRLDVQRMELKEVIESAIQTIKPAADAKGVRLVSVLDPLASPVSGDPNRLQQVFWNLLSNAVKFTSRGGQVQIVLERIHSHIEVNVIDTGDGIAAEFLPHVFDRFRQEDASMTRRHGGLGLGLAIVKQLVELHGGTIRVKSGGPGRGSTFIVALPLIIIHSEVESQIEHQHPAASSSSSLPAELLPSLDLEGLKIVVVDDEPDARLLAARLFQGCKAIVCMAGSAAEALALVQSEKPDILISDIGMPGEDGYSLISRVRALSPQQGGSVPAIALTAYARTEDRMRAIMAGFQMHMAKPVEGIELLTMVASLAGRNKKS